LINQLFITQYMYNSRTTI